jgi:SEC-C motif-containing protein
MTCPCGSGLLYRRCCEPLHDGAPAPTAEALMRSRYSAYVVGDADHLFRTWHPRTRPNDVDVPPGTTWLGLELLDVVDGGEGDAAGVVEFVARYRVGSSEHRLHERSRFERRARRWVYVDGTVS